MFYQWEQLAGAGMSVLHKNPGFVCKSVKNDVLLGQTTNRLKLPYNN